GEPDRAGGQIGYPQPCLHGADLALGGGAIGAQSIVPEARGARVVLAPSLDVVHLETVTLEIGDRHAEMGEVAAREYVAAKRDRRLRLFPVQPLVGRRAERDRMMKIEPARLEQAV